jgi:hypothetical protein
MTEQDASFADGAPPNRNKVKLMAQDAQDLSILSALMQDAIGKTSEVAWLPDRRIFALVVNRFRWEDAATAEAEGRSYERVRAGLHVQDVAEAKFRGFDIAKGQEVFEILSITFTPGEDGTGHVTIDCAGGAGFDLSVEALDVRMGDMDTVWRTQHLPKHEADA